MKLTSGTTEFFALDIGTSAVRVVQLTQSGATWTLSHFASAPVDLRVSTSDAASDQQKLGEIIMAVIGQSGIRTKNVVLGIPSGKVFATVVELPDMPKDELDSTIKYQADQYIPMSLDEAKIDWAVLSKVNKASNKSEVLIASVANSFIEARLDMVEGLGLNVLAIEPDSVALTRSLLNYGGVPEARLIVEVSDMSTDIIITYEDSPRLIRSIPTGSQSFIKAASQTLNVEMQQATQFVNKFGFQKDKLEGQVYRSVEAPLDAFAAEIIKSIKFFQTKYQNIPLTTMIASNHVTTIPGFADYLADKTGMKVEMGNPWQKVRVSASDQAAIQPIASQFSIAIGLAERGVS